MNLTDTTDIVFWDVPAPCSHSCPFLDLDLHAPEGGGLMRRQVGQCPQGPQQTNSEGQDWFRGVWKAMYGSESGAVGNTGIGALLVGIGGGGVWW